MPVEISEQELEAARRAIALIRGLESNPDARQHFERSVKTAFPQANLITEEERRAAILKPLQDEIAALRKEREDDKAAEVEQRKKADEAAQLANLETSFQRLREQGLQPDGEEKIKKIMVDRNIGDPEAAFAYFERQNPKPRAEQAGYTPSSWNYEEDVMPDAKAWFINADKAEEDTIGQVLVEMRRSGGES